MFIPALRPFYRAVQKTVALSREAWNQLATTVELHNAAIRSMRLTVTPPLSLAESDSGSLLKVTILLETFSLRIDAKVTTSGTARRGFYSATVLDKDQNGPGDGNVTVADFGSPPSGATSVIFGNMSELANRGAPSLKADGSVVVSARRSTNNLSLGDPSFQNLPYYVGDAYVSPFARISVTGTTGSAGSPPTYSGSWPDGSSFSAVTPDGRSFPDAMWIDAGTKAVVYYDGTAWGLQQVIDEKIHNGCS